MEQKHAHVSWKLAATAVMVTVLLSSLATAEVRGDTNLSLEKMQQNKPQFEHGQGAHERQEGLTEAGRMIMTPTIGVSGKYSKIQMVEEAYCQGFNHYHIGEIAELMQQIALGPYATDCRPSSDVDQRAAETNGTAICNHAEGQSSNESNASQGAVRTSGSSAEEGGMIERSI